MPLPTGVKKAPVIPQEKVKNSAPKAHVKRAKRSPPLTLNEIYDLIIVTGEQSKFKGFRTIAAKLKRSLSSAKYDNNINYQMNIMMKFLQILLSVCEVRQK